MLCFTHQNYIKIVRTGFDSNPKQEWAQAQKARTMNL